MILIIDNYDSFTYNLVQYLGELGEQLRVCRNDRVSMKDIEHMSPDAIVISPGPGSPKDAGISKDVIRGFAGDIPILGVCLGHQCIGEVYGARIVRGCRIMHGKVSSITHDGDHLFEEVPSPFTATRYHSLIIDPGTMRSPLVTTASTEDGEIMGVRHTELPVFGVQFHPESILSEHGKRILKNFIRMSS
ncbi:MAG: anthranilate/aminodeoxychorismate synthase component II [Candidatus Omnitrophica bacterium]|nr:anthranilate/aminodeoxychorismate synthase component II [Candidatus Omnitrophota bacterium]